VVASGHKVLGAPTSGLICGRKSLVRACYLQNWGIGRAMKVGKEGIVGLMAALEAWATRDASTSDRAKVEWVVHAPGGIRLVPYDPDFADALEATRDYMRRHRDALRELAK